MDKLVRMGDEEQAARYDLLVEQVTEMLLEQSGLPLHEALNSDDERAQYARSYVLGWLEDNRLQVIADEFRGN